MHLFHAECIKFQWEGKDKNGTYYVFGPYENDTVATDFLEQVVMKNHHSEISAAFPHHPKDHLGRITKEAYLMVYVK